MKKIVIIISIIVLAIASVVMLRENIIRKYQGGAFFVRDVPNMEGTTPVIDHTYGLHPAIWNVFYNQPDGEKLFDLAAEIGAPYVRVGFARQWIQTAPDEFHWDVIQQSVDQASARGLKIIPSIHHGHSFWGAKPLPEKHNTKSFTSGVPIDLSTTWDPQYGYSKTIYEYYQALLKKFPNTFPYIAIGNEPNAESYWAGTYEEYIRLLQTAAKAIHETDSTVKVIDGGIASEAWGCIAYDYWDNGMWTEQQAMTFVRGYYQTTNRRNEISNLSDDALLKYITANNDIAQECVARRAYFKGLVGHVDAVNFHLYEDVAYLDDIIDYLQTTMRANGWQNPVIVTNELGNKQYQNPDYDVAGKDQADDLRKKLTLATERGLPLIIWFSVNGEDSVTGGFLSLHDKDGTPYEAAYEYRRFLEEQAAQN